MSRRNRRQGGALTKVAGPLVGAGATALYLARNGLPREDQLQHQPPARQAREAQSLMVSTDASFVELIESVAAATTSVETIEDAMRACVTGMCQWTGWPVAHVYLADGEGNPLRSSDIWHLGHPDRFAPFREVTDRTAMPLGVGLPGRVMASGRAAWIVDVTCDLNFPRAQVCEEVGLRGAFCFPIPIGDTCFAVVECFSMQAVTPDPRLLEVAAHVGRQLGRVIESMQIQEALRESETRFRSVAESATDAIVAADEAGDIISWNAGAERIFSYTGVEVIGKPLSILMPPRFREMHDAGIRRINEQGMAASRLIGSTVEVVGLRKDGREFPLELSLATWTAPNGRFFSGIIRDISERKKAEDKIKALLETAPDPIVEVDGERNVVLANARTDQLFGYDRSEILDRGIEHLFANRSRDLVAARFDAVLQGGDESGPVGMGVDLWGQRKDGSEFPVDVTLSALATDAGVVVTSIIRDITERKRFETQLQHLADHDALTELFNRRRFEEEVAEYTEFAARYGEEGAVLLLDLDRFKYVNDTHGHKAGDEVIRTVGSALRDAVRKTDVVARLGGDEFAVLLKNADRSESERVANLMLELVRARQLPIEGHRVTMTTSIGVALFGDDEPKVEDLLVQSDLAMYEAKDAGGNRFVTSAGDGSHLIGMQARLGAVEQIRRGLDDNRFVLYCQPILDLKTDRVSQYELLLRLTGDNGELIPPAAFIATAERFGLIQEIDRWVISRAIEILDAHDLSTGRLCLEVNVSGRSMGDPDLPGHVERELARYAGVDPRDLIFEITETAAIANMEQAREFADRLTSLGCQFALDDFGAGFSSFYYLKYLPLDFLKIDGDFIKSITSSVTDQLVVKSMVDIARGMGMKTIAEFVEAPETVAMLQEKGVDYSQGYYHGVPRPVSEVISPNSTANAPARDRERELESARGELWTP